MSLIDKKKTVEAIATYLFVNDAIRGPEPRRVADYLVFAESMLKDVPDLNVVRCKECRYYNARYFECECDWASTDHEGGASYSLDRNPDGYCSYGEREGE